MWCLIWWAISWVTEDKNTESVSLSIYLSIYPSIYHCIYPCIYFSILCFRVVLHVLQQIAYKLWLLLTKAGFPLTIFDATVVPEFRDYTKTILFFECFPLDTQETWTFFSTEPCFFIEQKKKPNLWNVKCCLNTSSWTTTTTLPKWKLWFQSIDICLKNL